MKGLIANLKEKNPNQYNGEVLKSHQSSRHPNSSQSIDNEGLTKSKKVYIESSYTS